MAINLIGRGRCGWHASGAESGNQFSSSGATLEKYLAEAKDETPIYDASEADCGAFASFIVSGPMVNTTLNPGEVQSFGNKAVLARMLPGLKGAFKAIGAMCLVEKDNQEVERSETCEVKRSVVGSMDYIATDLYLGLLKAKVPGVKIGVVRNHQVVWLS